MRKKKVAVAISKSIGFLRRQPRNWKITVTRSSLRTFVYKIIFPYQSIYAMGLGATATQLGIINTIGMGIAGLFGPFIGWIIDRIGVKRVYLIGIGLLVVSYLIYGVAQSWIILIAAMIAFWLGDTTSGHTCSTVCANSLSSRDRATGMSFCETLAAGLLGIVGPIVGASVVASSGGVNVKGIKPLFFISALITLGTFFLILTQLSNQNWKNSGERKSSFFKDIGQVFKQGKNLKRWIVIASVGMLPMGMVFPFIQVFAHEIKGADQYILGAIVAGSALTPLVLGIPLGRLADKIGRKKVLYLTSPLFWISNLMLIWAPNSGFLIASGILQGFFIVSMTVAGAMTVELVPPEHMGRWIGILRFFRLLLAACVAYLAGVIWDHLGPHYIFLISIGLDAFIRIPLLIGIPETLDLRIGRGEKGKKKAR